MYVSSVFTPQPLRLSSYYFRPWCPDGGKSLSGLYLRNLKVWEVDSVDFYLAIELHPGVGIL